MPSKKILGLIPARAGSKGVPHKNVANVAGKPLIAWTIQAAQGAKGLDRLIVSTDSQTIADIAVAFGAEVPFLRPAEYARDDTPAAPPVLHALEWLEKNEQYRPDFVMLLQPTSPLRATFDIDAAIALLDKTGADSVVSVTPATRSPYWMKTITADGRLADFIPGDVGKARRQDLPPVYALNGAIYLVRREIFQKTQSWYTDRSYAYVMPDERSLDIDTPWDLRVAGLALGAVPS